MDLVKLEHIFYISYIKKKKKILLPVSKLFASPRLKDLRLHNLCSNVKGWGGKVEGKADV